MTFFDWCANIIELHTRSISYTENETVFAVTRSFMHCVQSSDSKDWRHIWSPTKYLGGVKDGANNGAVNYTVKGVISGKHGKREN